ncbi:hypothetical protein FACS189472_00370 [Alphaproteobacteria bacterium]|nr:hypothetical protein FACS189472_00370 [Alphaproteobacteria bacterium]
MNEIFECPAGSANAHVAFLELFCIQAECQRCMGSAVALRMTLDDLHDDPDYEYHGAQYRYDRLATVRALRNLMSSRKTDSYTHMEKELLPESTQILASDPVGFRENGHLRLASLAYEATSILTGPDARLNVINLIFETLCTAYEIICWDSIIQDYNWEIKATQDASNKHVPPQSLLEKLFNLFS